MASQFIRTHLNNTVDGDTIDGVLGVTTLIWRSGFDSGPTAAVDERLKHGQL